MSNLMVMCEFGGMGIIRDVRFEKKYIRDNRRAIVLISEFHRTMWVWLGMEVNMKTRKQAEKVTEKFKIKGYKIDGEIMGQNFNNVIIMDARTMAAGKDPQMQQNYDQFLAMIDALNVVPHGTSTHIVETQESGQGQTETQAQILGATTYDPKNEGLAGILLISLLHQYPDVFVSRSATGVIQVETSTGEIFKFKVEQLEIHMIEGYVNEKIQNLYSQFSQNYGK
ncbi:MAG: hypothetical protein ACTSO9_07415 [Candidatus Helarchaeota archaeon]